MLVLTRKLREQIQIGQDITVTIVRVQGNSVRLGIEAPKSVKVTRRELLANSLTPKLIAQADEGASPVVVEANDARAMGAGGDVWAVPAEAEVKPRGESSNLPPLAVGPRGTSLPIRAAGPRQAPLAGMVRRLHALT